MHPPAGKVYVRSVEAEHTWVEVTQLAGLAIQKKSPLLLMLVGPQVLECVSFIQAHIRKINTPITEKAGFSCAARVSSCGFQLHVDLWIYVDFSRIPIILTSHSFALEGSNSPGRYLVNLFAENLPCRSDLLAAV